MSSGTSVITDIASTATAIGALFVGWQLLLTQRQLRASFEETFTARYDKIVGRIPLVLMLDAGAINSEQVKRAFYDYFELTEEELYYRSAGKISRSTWHDWWYGICSNMSRPAFQAAWTDLRDATNGVGGEAPMQFVELRRGIPASGLLARSYDPRRSRWGQRLPHG